MRAVSMGFVGFLAVVATPSSALAAPLVVRGANGPRSLTCEAGQEVRIEGSGHRIELSGPCGELTVRGDRARVTVDGVSSIVVVGSDNDITWSRNLSGRERLPVRTTGSGNRVHPEGGRAASDAPPAADAPAPDGRGSGPGALVVRGARVRDTLTCAPGQAVEVRGTSHEIRLEGDCGELTVDGTSITVHADGVAAIRVQGSMDTVTWARNLSGAERLPVTKVGTMLTVTGP